MYKIEFYDFSNKLIATHFISADDLPLVRECIESYCLMVSNSYKIVSNWIVYQYSGIPLFTGFRS